MSEGQPPTKHAKDRSNSDALLAPRCSRIPEGCGSERDSGYSDTSSDRLQTGAEVRLESEGHAEVPGQTQVLLPGRSLPPHPRETTALLVRAGTEIGPVYILQNLMLRQDRVSLPGTALKAGVQSPLWTGPTGGSAGSGAGPLLLLQQTSVVPPRPPLAPPPSKSRTHMGQKGPDSGRRRPSPYLRIAPRPGRTTPASPTPDPLRGREAGPYVHREEPAVTPPLSAGQRLPSLSSSCVSSSSSTSKGRDPRGLQSAAPPAATATGRYRRFLHTMRALKRSGLLDLTLRTQELLRQSAASGRAVGQLARHARLLGQLERGEPAPWERLHQAMARSGGYPSLELIHQETPSLGSPSPGLNQSPAGSVTPDSSTGLEVDVNRGSCFLSADSRQGGPLHPEPLS